MTDLADMSLGDVAALVASRRVSPVEVTLACLARADTTESRLNAFSLRLPETALAAARHAEAEIMAGRHLGPLHGIPVAVKEMFDVAGHPTTGSSRAYADNIAIEDSAAVARLKRAGAVIVGKTHTHELAYGVTTPQTRNPWGSDHSPGGSSGGSAASVAAGSSFMALGTDTGGSIRIPAACCGITGLKPTYGLCSTFGTMPLSPTLDHVGPMTRTAADAALCLQTLAGHDARDPRSVDIPVPDFSCSLGQTLAGVRIGVAIGGIHERVDPQVAGAIVTAVRILAEAGVEVRYLEVPPTQDAQMVGNAICLPEASAFHSGRFRDRPGSFSPDIAQLLRDGSEVPATVYVAALERRRRMGIEWSDIFSRVDVVLAPTLPARTLPRTGQSISIEGTEETVAAAYVRLCVPANVAGLPAISMPCGFDSDGLPLAFQIIARPFDDGFVLRICNAWQRLTGWHDRRPPRQDSYPSQRMRTDSARGSKGTGAPLF